MLLNGEEIRARQLVLDEDPGRYRGATYDLTIGTIMQMVPTPTSGNDYPQKVELQESSESIRVEPQGMVKVVSRESLRLPTDIVGFALVKNEQSNTGLLALNIGVIDPGYEGQISSTLINFGSKALHLEKGTPFLRISFYHVQASRYAAPKQYKKSEYLREARRQVVDHFSPTFLNLDRFVDQSSQLAFGQFKSYLNFWVPVAALLAVVITIFVPVLVDAAYRYVPMLSIKDHVASQVQTQFDDIIAPQLEDLKRRIDGLEEAQGAVATQDPGETIP